ncbi:hypothetical protein WME76_27935 [Sorangium sp. So ce119]|uniref:hypothetical protein n=1 Tax=Sorangium sp. So ce119 TaxID=3133279 RepID=UPI003F628D66
MHEGVWCAGQPDHSCGAARTLAAPELAQGGCRAGNAQKLFLEAHRRDLQRMIFIAVSLTVALVAADLLELGSRRRDRA